MRNNIFCCIFHIIIKKEILKKFIKGKKIKNND